MDTQARTCACMHSTIFMDKISFTYSYAIQFSIRKAWETLEKVSRDDQKFDLTDCWELLEDDEDCKKLLTHLVGVGDLKVTEAFS